MKIYYVHRVDQGQPGKGIVRCEVHNDETGEVYELPHVVYHSPTGYEYGYMGSGPADLALSILADFFQQSKEAALRHIRTGAGDGRAWWLHQAFKAAFIATKDQRQHGFSFSEYKIRMWTDAALEHRANKAPVSVRTATSPTTKTNRTT